ncbi:MAG TPA: hypothetical protein VIX86_24480 [Streptosporangiaceae bacterium]
MAGRHWLLDRGFAGFGNGFNGWINGGRLVPLPPQDGYAAAQAW